MRGPRKFTGFYSSDAVTWTQLGSPQTITLGAGALIGLAVSSHNTSSLATSTFTNVSVQLLPSGWNDNDVGAPEPPGSAVYNGANNTFTVSGGGADIGGGAGSVQLRQPCGNGRHDHQRRIDSIANTNSNAKAGVMIRSDLSAGRVRKRVADGENGVLFDCARRRVRVHRASRSRVSPRRPG